MMQNINPLLLKELRCQQFERMENGGLFLPKARVKMQGLFGNRVLRNGAVLHPWQFSDNIIVNQGLDHILDTVLHAGTPVTTWFMAIFEGNYTPVATDTAANITANSTESTAYDEATRVEYVEAAASSQSTTNSASPAVFTINATKTIHGAFLASVSTKSATTGTLLAASRFSLARAVIDNDVLEVTYTISAADA